MQTRHIFNPFEILFLRLDECPIRTHKHSFFELAYIMDGEGTHNINGNDFRYKPGSLYLLGPLTTHHFTVEKTTSFVFVCFNNIYLKGITTGNEEQHSPENWMHKLEYIFQSKQDQGEIIRNERDKPLVAAIIAGLAAEHEQGPNMQKELVQQLINTLITIVARNITIKCDAKTGGDTIALQIINYVHLNIYDAEKLKAENIAEHFNISTNYISEYFKKQTGENLQQFIINYKLSLAETRLRHSNMRLNEIAYELGFTDESHLTKTFKKYKGESPAQFRKNIRGNDQTPKFKVA
ncbi:AraC family transcriptional regulator [Mucilaginibacter sp. HC2]|uniref:AraC family transcriptional regulator n=1 Tax=Mucilaginibacter inviolabilis TaxID=2714892 RepID=UPI0014076A7B|nr:AraC family transcriptional regulator [Mucilaginibacter inviolabilis]NHA05938.1 AraC family transcriptional regulator [Mucilaginibacter inviolabilis]